MSVFHHLPQRGEGKNSRVKVVKPNQVIRIIKLNQIRRLIKSNQGIRIIGSKIYSIAVDCQMLNHDRCQDTPFLHIRNSITLSASMDSL